MGKNNENNDKWYLLMRERMGLLMVGKIQEMMKWEGSRGDR